MLPIAAAGGASKQALCLQGGSILSRGLGLRLSLWAWGRGGHHSLGTTAGHHAWGSRSTLGLSHSCGGGTPGLSAGLLLAGSPLGLQAFTHVAVRGSFWYLLLQGH